MITLGLKPIAFVVGVVCVAARPDGTSIGPPVPTSTTAMSCEATEREDRLPSIVAPMAGADPVWLVDGGMGRWHSAPTKTLWVLRRMEAGELEIVGSQLDGAGILTFQTGDGPAVPALKVAYPFTQSIIPGGSSPEVMNTYAFVSSLVVYPSPGCWEYRIRLGEYERRVVVAVQ